MRSTAWALSFGTLAALAACGGGSSEGGEAGVPINDASAEAASSWDAGQDATLDALAPDATVDALAQDDATETVRPPTSSLFLMIDDMEEGKVDLPAFPPGSAGFWWPLGPLGNWFFKSPDSSRPSGDALADNILPPRADSKKARRVQGMGFAGGTDLFAQLKHPSSAPVDLRPFAGLAFWARLTSPSGRLIVALGQKGPVLPAKPTDAPVFAQAVAVSDQWQRLILLFDDFREGVIGGASSGSAPSPDAVTNIDFVVGLNGEPFDLWIDDLALLCRGVCQ